MANLGDIATALQNADAAGDTASAQQLAQAYKAMQAQPAPDAQHSPAALNSAYWNADAAGDEPGKQAAFNALRAQGAALGAPDAQTLQAATMSQHNPTADSSFGQNALEGFGHSFVQTGRAVAQLVGAQNQSDADTQAAADAPLMNTGGGVLGNVAGYGAQAVIPGGALKAVTFLPKVAEFAGAGADAINAYKGYAATANAGLDALNTYKGIGALGAAQGALTPVQTGQSRLTNTAIGAGAGLAGKGLVDLAGAAVSGAGKILPDFTDAQRLRTATQAVMDRAQNPTAATDAILNNPQQIVSGSQPTTAELSNDPGLYGLQRALGSTPEFGANLQQQAFQNNAARVQAIRNAFGGADDTAIANATAARNTATAPLLDAAKASDTPIPVKPVVDLTDSLIAGQQGRPAVQSALNHVRQQLIQPADPAMRLNNAVNMLGSNATASLTPADQAVAQRLQSAIQQAAQSGDDPQAMAPFISNVPFQSEAGRQIGRDVSQALTADTVPTSSFNTLYNARKTIGDLMEGRVSGQEASSQAATQQLMQVKNALDQQVKTTNPAFGQYLDTFSNMSKPVDQAQVGQTLLAGARQQPDVLGNPVLLPNKFASQTADLNQLTQQATGFGKANAMNTLTPDQVGTIGNVRNDLARMGNAQLYGSRGGSDTVQKAVGLGQLGQSIGSRAAMSGASMIPGASEAMAILNNVRSSLANKTFATLQNIMLDPSKMAEGLSALAPVERSKVVQILGTYRPGLAATARATALSMSGGQKNTFQPTGGQPALQANAQ